MKFIQFWQRETESHDTWKCIAAATSDIIRGRMLQKGGGGGWRIARQLSGFSKDNSTHLKKVIVIKMIQLICVWWVLQVDTCYRGGGESTLGYQRLIVLHLYVKLNYPDIANKILFLVFVFLFWSFSVFIFLFWYFSVLSFCLEKGKQNYIRAVLHCDIFF